jgi:hypothetical protein
MLLVRSLGLIFGAKRHLAIKNQSQEEGYYVVFED